MLKGWWSPNSHLVPPRHDCRRGRVCGHYLRNFCDAISPESELSGATYQVDLALTLTELFCYIDWSILYLLQTYPISISVTRYVSFVFSHTAFIILALLPQIIPSLSASCHDFKMCFSSIRIFAFRYFFLFLSYKIIRNHIWWISSLRKCRILQIHNLCIWDVLKWNASLHSF